MDFGRNLRKRAKQIDKNLDKIVKNPYEEYETKPVTKNIKKPLYISLGSALACLVIGLFVFNLTKNINIETNQNVDSTLNNNNESGIREGDTNSNTNTSNNTGKTNNDNQGGNTTETKEDPPVIDVDTRYDELGFGFAECIYLSYYSSTSLPAPSQPSMAIRKALSSIHNQNTLNKEVDDLGRYVYPLEERPWYMCDNFCYFEFDSEGSTFLEDRIGNGRIQAFTVHTDIFSEHMLVLKNGENYYSCLTNSLTNGYPDFKILKLGFSAHKFIEGWNIIKDMDLFIPLDVEFEAGAGYLGCKTITIDGQTFNVDSDSVYYFEKPFIVDVADASDIHSTLVNGGLAPKTALPPVELELGADTLDLPEFEGMFDHPFTREQEWLENDYIYSTSRGKENLYPISGIYLDQIHNSVFAVDLNYDGYREIVYLMLNDEGIVCVTAYDAKHRSRMKELIYNREYSVWFRIEENSLICYAYSYDEVEGIEHIYDTGTIGLHNNANNNLKVNWDHMYKNEKLVQPIITDTEGIDRYVVTDDRHIYIGLEAGTTYYLSFKVTFDMDCDFFEWLDPFWSALSFKFYTNDYKELPLEFTFVSEQDGKYTFSFAINDTGTYRIKIFFNDLSTGFANIVVS